MVMKNWQWAVGTEENFIASRNPKRRAVADNNNL
jgi:hypothetical protein